MRKLLLAIGILMAAAVCQAQSRSVSLTWTATDCASTITTDANGVELTGPCVSQVYRAEVASGSQCPAFSVTAYTEIQSAQPENSSAAAYVDTTVTTGATYCYAVTDTFALGGAVSQPSNLFQITVILPGTPGTPGNLTGTVK